MGEVQRAEGPLGQRGSVGVWQARLGGRGHPLLVHALGLRAQDEAEEVLVRDRGALGGRRGRCAPLVIQPGALRGKPAINAITLNITMTAGFTINKLTLKCAQLKCLSALGSLLTWAPDKEC